MYVSNPLHCPPSVSTSNHDKGEGEIGTTNVTVTGHPPWPLSSSTPFQRPSDDSTRHETTAFSVAKLSDSLLRLDHEPADVVVKNPLFGSGLEFKKVKWNHWLFTTVEPLNNRHNGMDPFVHYREVYLF